MDGVPGGARASPRRVESSARTDGGRARPLHRGLLHQRGHPSFQASRSRAKKTLHVRTWQADSNVNESAREKTHLGTRCDGVPLGKRRSKAECALPPLSLRLRKQEDDHNEITPIFGLCQSCSAPSQTYLLLFLCSALSSSSTFLLRLSFNTLRTLSLEQGSTGDFGRPAHLRWSML